MPDYFAITPKKKRTTQPPTCLHVKLLTIDDPFKPFLSTPRSWIKFYWLGVFLFIQFYLLVAPFFPVCHSRSFPYKIVKRTKEKKWRWIICEWRTQTSALMCAQYVIKLISHYIETSSRVAYTHIHKTSTI